MNLLKMTSHYTAGTRSREGVLNRSLEGEQSAANLRILSGTEVDHVYRIDYSRRCAARVCADDVRLQLRLIFLLDANHLCYASTGRSNGRPSFCLRFRFRHAALSTLQIVTVPG